MRSQAGSRFLAVALAALVLSGVCRAEPPDPLAYNQANALYRAGRFPEAVEKYETLVTRGVKNADVYYNLGNAHYKAGNLGRAILSYERALRLAPDDEDVTANLRFVNALRRDKIEEEEANVAGRVLSAVYGWFTADAIALLCSVCLFCLSAGAIAWLAVPSRRPVWLGALVLTGSSLVVAGFLLSMKIHDLEAVRQGVILADEAGARSGPGADYLQVFAVHEGTKVTLERDEAGWVLVRLPNGIGGWVPKTSMDEI